MAVDKEKQGRLNRKHGAQFELDVRANYEAKGWTIGKWQNNINLETGEIINAKNYFIPGRGAMLGAGFPDFVLFKKRTDDYEVLFIECKLNGRLTAEEKKKLNVMVKKGHRCFIAYKDDGEIATREFLEY